MKIKFLFALLFVGVFCHYTIAQNDDFGSWNGLSLSKDLPSKFDLGVNFQFRLNENASQVKTFFSDINLSRKLHDNVKVFVSYRIGKKRQLDSYYLAAQRFSGGFSFKQKIGKTKFVYRMKYQNNNNNFLSSEPSLNYNSSFRNKISLKRKVIGKTYLSSSYELFSGSYLSEFVITDWRWKVGVERKIKKRHYLTIGYQVQQELVGANPVKDYVVFLGYEIQLKKWKKKKKSEEKNNLSIY